MILLTFTLLFSVWFYKAFLCFLSREDPLALIEDLFWWCWNLLLLLVCKIFYFSFIFEENFAGQSNIDCRFFSSITLIMSSHSLLVWRVSVESSAVIFMGIPLCVIRCFFPATFNSCFLCLIFLSLTNICLGCLLIGTLENHSGHWLPSF